jgi:hypothetical protein
MKKVINPLYALQLAQATELIKAYQNGVDLPINSEGKIIPSRESLEEIRKNYVISDERPPQPKDKLTR